MSPKLDELLLCWEDLRREGKPVSVDALCHDCPGLRDELRAQISALEKMDRVLDLPDDEPSKPGFNTWSITVSSEGNGARQPALKSEPRRTRYDDLRPGWEPIAGYRLEKQLGKGGIGEVWKAIGPGGFSVALKFVPLTSQLGASELRSLDVIKTLRHPNLVAIFGAWQVYGFLVIAMEMADRTLMDRLNEMTAKGECGIPRDELIKYMQEAAKGIDYLNQPDANLGDSAKEAIQHRDIKPQNIFLMGGGVKIGDFGLLRILKKTVTEHTGSLTLSYAAPEFFMGHTSRHSDQYSLAVTYCHLRGGRLPFVGNPGQIMQGHLEGLPDLTMLPVEERKAVERALQKDAEKRWPTCAELVKVLADCKTSDSLPGAAPATIKPFTVNRPRALGFLAVTLLIAGSLWWWIANSGNNAQSNKSSDTDASKDISSIPSTDKTTPLKDMPATKGSDLNDLSGTWIVQSRISNGKRETPWFYQLRIDGNQMKFSHSRTNKKDSTWAFDIDPAKSPKTLDRTSDTKIVHEIYKIEGNQLTVASAPTNASKRPTDFKSLNGSNVIVEVWKRN